MSKAEKERLSVYSVHQAEKVNGKFQKKFSKVVREEVKVVPSYAETCNENYKNSGKYYELNEDLTKDLHEAYDSKEPQT